jgi:uncharacterized membrane protein HdeD (DUF308 family)
MAAILVGDWLALALRGALAILFTLIAFFWPGITAVALALVFGAYLLIAGAFTLVAGCARTRQHGRLAPMLVEGTVTTVIAIIVLVWPLGAVLALIWLIALWKELIAIVIIEVGIALSRQASGRPFGTVSR